MFFTTIILLQLICTDGQLIYGDIDANGPEPMIPHTSINEPAIIPLGSENGCICRELPRKMSICYGSVCKTFPSTIRVKLPVLKFRNTLVSVIRKDDFQMLNNLTFMEIESNLKLVKFEPGCFRHMNKLINLSISFNANLKMFDEGVFEGLINLKELYLRKNALTKIIDISRVLTPKYLPCLLKLTLNRNIFREIEKDDFLPMHGSTLEELNAILCQIENIHPEVLRPLRKLKALRLGENLFSKNTITELIYETIQFGIPLQLLNLYEVGFRGETPKSLLQVVAKSNITYLNLGRNHFEQLDDDSFPDMPNLETLVLRDDVTVDITQNTFAGMKNLKQFFMSGNKLTYIHEGLLLKGLVLLDVSSNSEETYFEIPEEVFRDMISLQKLDLSNNRIETITNKSFIGLHNLTMLRLSNAYIRHIKIGAFMTLGNLKHLNLENNFIGTAITYELFEGLNGLQVLLLGGCEISNLTTKPSLFSLLPNLNYLGLERNGLYVISGDQFLPMTYLSSIDLSENSLSPWNERLFTSSNLRYLNAAQNKFAFVSMAMLEDFSPLDYLIMEENPFTCDCSWYVILVWLKTNRLSIKPSITTDSYIASCVAPERWRRISIAEYIYYLRNHTEECEDTQFADEVIISISSILFVLTVSVTVLVYVYRWNIKYWIFLARVEIRKRNIWNRNTNKETRENKEYQYDAFVSYSNEDNFFVAQLVAMLENNAPYLKLCVYERDFEIGTVISAAVMQSLSVSRRIILVISDAFARSQWCRWETQLAECHQLYKSDDGTDDGLLLIILDKVSDKNMVPILKYIMDTRVYLEWKNEPMKENIFWEKLRNTLTPPKNDTNSPDFEETFCMSL